MESVLIKHKPWDNSPFNNPVTYKGDITADEMTAALSAHNGNDTAHQNLYVDGGEI
jgi:hypothetical protein